VVEDSFSPSSNFVSAGLVASLVMGGGLPRPELYRRWLAGRIGVFDTPPLTVTNVLVALGASVSKNYVNISAIAATGASSRNLCMMLAGLGLVGFMVRRKSGVFNLIKFGRSQQLTAVFCLFLARR